jgi:hypothetical protein
MQRAISLFYLLKVFKYSNMASIRVSLCIAIWNNKGENYYFLETHFLFQLITYLKENEKDVNFPQGVLVVV